MIRMRRVFADRCPKSRDDSLHVLQEQPGTSRDTGLVFEPNNQQEPAPVPDPRPKICPIPERTLNRRYQRQRRWCAKALKIPNFCTPIRKPDGALWGVGVAHRATPFSPSYSVCMAPWRFKSFGLRFTLEGPGRQGRGWRLSYIRGRKVTGILDSYPVGEGGQVGKHCLPLSAVAAGDGSQGAS